MLPISVRSSLSAVLPLLLVGTISAQVGSVIGRFPTPAGLVPVGLGHDLAGNLFLTSTGPGALHRISPSGSLLSSWAIATNTGTPNGATTNGTNIFVTDSSALTGGAGVDVYDLSGNYVRSFGVAATFPAGITWVATTGNLLITDRVVANALEYDLQGNLIATYPMNGTQNDGCAYDVGTNSYWIYDGGTDTVRNYDNNLTETQNFPGTNAAVGAPGRGLAHISGIAYIVAQRNREIVLFDTTGASAAMSKYGRGCPNQAVFYELWATGAGDMGGRAIRFTSQNGRGWFAASGGTFETNLGTNLGMNDDTILRSQALGFSFPLPSSPIGSTTAIDIASNGWVGPNPTVIPDTGYYTQCSGAEFVKYERIAAYWNDLNPATAPTGGGVFFNTLSNPTRAVITWNNVPTFGQNDSNTFQIQLFASGDMVIVWQSGCVVGTGQSGALAGYSSGHNAPDPGSIDLSATIPVVFGPYGIPLELAATRPTLGSTINYTVTYAPTNALLGAILFGTQQLNLPLDAINMPGCTLLCSGDLWAGPYNVQSGTFAFGVPNSNGLAGLGITNQAVVVAPGANPFGAIASNGVQLRLGY